MFVCDVRSVLLHGEFSFLCATRRGVERKMGFPKHCNAVRGAGRGAGGAASKTRERLRVRVRVLCVGYARAPR